MGSAESEPPGGHRVAVLANARAGTHDRRWLVGALVRRLERMGLSCRVFWERERLSEEVARRRRELRCVVAAGGDGTVLEVANRAPGLPLAILPLGNENLVARHYGLAAGRLRLGRLVAGAIASGRRVPVDAGRASGRLFCLVASAGLDADVVHRVHRRRRGHISRRHYVVAVLRALARYRFPVIDVEVVDTGERLSGCLALVCNLPEYGPGLRVAPRARPDDGLLDLYVFQRPGLWSLAGYLVDVVCGRHGVRSDVHYRQVRAVRLGSRSEVPLQVDGDPAGFLPAVVEVVPGALTVLVP